MEEILKEIVEALRESNKLTCEILKLWKIVEERTQTQAKNANIHDRASAFIVFDKTRKLYNESLKDLVENPDDANLQLATELLRMEVLEVSRKIFPIEKITLSLPEVSDMVKYYISKKEEEEEGNKK